MPQNRGLFYKCNNNTDVKLIKYFLEDNGFRPVKERDQEFSLMWSCSTIKSQVYQALNRYQKVNHFPKSSEITRKDFMYRLLDRMRAIHGKFQTISKALI